MNNCMVNFTTLEACTNSTTNSVSPLYMLEMCLHGFNFLVGLPTHSYVIWLIIVGSGSAFEFIILNLSVSEIGYCLNAVVTLLSFWFPRLLTLNQFLVGLIITGRPLFQCLICVERYLAVVHPVTFLKYKPLRYKVIGCTAAWILILGSCVICMFTIISHSTVYMWFFLIQFLLFFSIQLFCLVTVLRALKQTGPGERRRKRKEENNKMRRVIYLILITTATLVVLYVPLTLTAVHSIVTKVMIQDVWFSAVICYVLAGFVQPVLYLNQSGKLSCLCSV
ncbi:C-C chemokine receptor type 8-like [Labeo rohita]|uniref:C-C chemokine receptor type 8-like n=1 Tax=Labeo rohita TaxID=84645 RepID=UPI0021E2F8A2|nr:C-C chemokine receptor type 8-like [Labeo rohita]